VFLQYFDTVGCVFWPVKSVAHITYTVLAETLKHAQSINQWALHVTFTSTFACLIFGLQGGRHSCSCFQLVYDLWKYNSLTLLPVYAPLYTSTLFWSLAMRGGTAAAAPPPFRPGNPALCGSCPLVTPYYCRLGDLLCYMCMLYLSTFCVCLCMCILCFLCSLCCFPLQLSPSVLWYCWLGVLTCKNRLPYNLYCVGGDVKHCTIQSKAFHLQICILVIIFSVFYSSV